ncbi:MAG: 2-phosphosulfolactate phosphatase [Lentimicrobium sp.]|jgi:2-phosphosulfolactate phosphatase|nr:2-phosphosulfolactate phosphatase [Lentimicrobium sp.]
MTKTLEVSFSPALYPFRITSGNHITVVMDVLRFTTSLISAFENGVNKVIPVSTLDEAERLKNEGYPVAAERNGLRLPFADYGNSAADFETPQIKGKTLVYSTTNGTVAMKLASANGPVVAAAFTNLNAVAQWLMSQNLPVVILCSGWKNLFSNEDALCAGALVEMLNQKNHFFNEGDEVDAVLSLWMSSKNNLKMAVMNGSHYQRLIKLGVNPLPDYTVNIGMSKVVPVFEDGLIRDAATG